MVSLQPKKKKKKVLGMNHSLHSSPSANNFIWESCHIVSTVTTNGIVRPTSVSDSHTDTAGRYLGVSLSSQAAEPQRNWKSLGRWGFIIGTQENFLTVLGSSVSLKYWNRGYGSTLSHAEEDFWRKGREKNCFLSIMSLGWSPRSISI